VGQIAHVNCRIDSTIFPQSSPRGRLLDITLGTFALRIARHSTYDGDGIAVLAHKPHFNARKPDFHFCARRAAPAQAV